MAFTNYQALAGNGEAVGDGVIPVGCAHLSGALQLTLDGVLHRCHRPLAPSRICLPRPLRDTRRAHRVLDSAAAPSTVLDLMRSINEAGTTLPTERWYGSEGIVDMWLEPTMAVLE